MTTTFLAPLTFPGNGAFAPSGAAPELKTVAPDSYRIKIVLHDGTVKLSEPLDGHEFTDRLAKRCLQDPTVKSAVAIPV